MYPLSTLLLCQQGWVGICPGTTWNRSWRVSWWPRLYWCRLPHRTSRRPSKQHQGSVTKTTQKITYVINKHRTPSYLKSFLCPLSEWFLLSTQFVPFHDLIDPHSPQGVDHVVYKVGEGTEIRIGPWTQTKHRVVNIGQRPDVCVQISRQVR